jgi:hypothetical protein
MKQTAVEWLLQQMDLETISKYDKQLVQAKEMEKEQHFNKWWHGLPENKPEFVFEQYYNENYGGNK